MLADLLVRKRKVHQNRLIVAKLYSVLVWLPGSHTNNYGKAADTSAGITLMLGWLCSQRSLFGFFTASD